VGGPESDRRLTALNVITWIAEGTWPACVDATRGIAPADAEIVLLYVVASDAPGAAHGAYAGLLGRGRPDRDPGQRLAELGAAAARESLLAAAERLERPCSTLLRHGRVEREVVAAAEGAGLLVVARDGDDTRLGPRSLGPASRFVVDHAPCPVLLVWPRETPGADSIPPPPAPQPHGPMRHGPMWHGPMWHGPMWPRPE
jgi:nucleotide-binding universal stress UspA family protein